jgi:nucleotide-binding universal stress UspA family protein
MAFKHVLVGTDFNECSDAAIKYAVEIAARYGAALTLVHAFDLPYAYASPFLGDLTKASQDAAQGRLAKVLEPIRSRLPSATGLVRCGSPWEQILEVAREQGADLIVVGSHGRKGVPRALLGSIAEKVLRLSTVPVLTVRGPSPA